MTKKGNIRPERGEKDKHFDLFNEITKGMVGTLRKGGGGRSFTPKGSKSQAELRREHGVKLQALRNKAQ